MTYLILKFLHVGSMFLATALAVGPIVVLVLILRTATLRPSGARSDSPNHCHGSAASCTASALSSGC